MLVPDLNSQTRNILDQHQNRIAEAIVTKCFELKPELERRYGAKGRLRCHEDTIYHLRYLSDAVGTNSTALFSDYVAWAKVLLAGFRIPTEDLVWNLEIMRETLRQFLSVDGYVLIGEFIQKAIDALPNASAEIPTIIKPEAPHHILAREYLTRLLEGKRREASALIMNAVNSGINVKEIYLHVFEPVQHEIGRLWHCNQLTVAQEHFCTAATQMIMSQLYAQIFATEKKGLNLVATSIGGELHEIGVRMVADFFEMEGWDTFYLGANTPAPSIVRAIIDRKAHVLAISATMTFHIGGVITLIQAVRNTPACAKTKILVGGYPFNIDRNLWKTVGADGYAAKAHDVHLVAEELLAA